MSESLKRTFYKRFGIIVIISFFLVSLCIIQVGRMILLEELKDKGESIAHILSSVVLDTIIIHDYATLERYVKDIENEKFIVNTVITRADGKVLAGQPIPEQENTFAVQFHIHIGEEVFGNIRITFSTSRVDSFSRNMLVAAVLSIIAFYALGVALTNMVLSRTVIEPLKRLNSAIHTIKGGNLRERISFKNPREFSEIADSFNDMAEKIQESFQKINESNQSLNLERTKLSAILESVADGLFVTNNSREIVAFNRSAERITGYSEKKPWANRVKRYSNPLCAIIQYPVLFSGKRKS
jgi:methyl-accepting chemotaxis protein